LRCTLASYERILMKFVAGVGHGPGTNRLDFGGNPVTLPLFCPNFSFYRSVLVFVRWQRHNATAVNRDPNGCQRGRYVCRTRTFLVDKISETQPASPSHRSATYRCGALLRQCSFMDGRSRLLHDMPLTTGCLHRHQIILSEDVRTVV